MEEHWTWLFWLFGWACGELALEMLGFGEGVLTFVWMVSDEWKLVVLASYWASEVDSWSSSLFRTMLMPFIMLLHDPNCPLYPKFPLSIATLHDLRTLTIQSRTNFLRCLAEVSTILDFDLRYWSGICRDAYALSVLLARLRRSLGLRDVWVFRCPFLFEDLWIEQLAETWSSCSEIALTHGLPVVVLCIHDTKLVHQYRPQWMNH